MKRVGLVVGTCAQMEDDYIYNFIRIQTISGGPPPIYMLSGDNHQPHRAAGGLSPCRIARPQAS